MKASLFLTCATLILLAACGSERWTYKTVTVTPKPVAEEGSAAKLAGTVLDADKAVADLNQLGASGWEVVGVLPEIETAFPNFGNDDYHTGIKTNTRTARWVVLMKRAAR